MDKEILCREEMSGGIYTHAEYVPLREVTRCKDCVKRYNHMYCPCNTDRSETDDYWFCADGRPKRD